jgi:uncharacterized linocin/CFP29 family protein
VPIIREADPVVFATGELHETVLTRQTARETIDLEQELGRDVHDLDTERRGEFNVEVASIAEAVRVVALLVQRAEALGLLIFFFPCARPTSIP